MNIKFVKLVFFVMLTMSAFAANSFLARLAISNNELGPASFSFIRLLSGTIILIIIISLRSGLNLIWKTRPNKKSILGLSLYMLGFHYAYYYLEAGIGSIILFGGVQLVMFFSAIISKENPTFYNWFGMIMAMLGILILFFPKDLSIAQPTSGVILMILAAVGWGIYSISGKDSKDPIASTMSNFIFTLPIVTLNLIIHPDIFKLSILGVFLAICSGAIMSALGYSLWYTILPLLEKTVASLVQLFVPIIALILSIIFLSERFTYLHFLSSILIIGGVSVGIFFDRINKDIITK
tara:strand:+ start:68 stop:949 length:882 start_codon:yes stop_codon:yes gene_type:complete